MNILMRLLAYAGVLLVTSVQAFGANIKEESWQGMVVKGNGYRDRDRMADARKCYNNALKALEKQGIDDVRKAMVLHDIAETFRSENNLSPARVVEVRAHSIYAKEIAAHQLGYEYASRKPIDFESGSLRPACYLCHENWKVVPILYGHSTGYKGETPSESESSFTHKPGGAEYGDQRWYCRDCRQSF